MTGGDGRQGAREKEVKVREGSRAGLQLVGVGHERW